jgi:hypothetical protein
MDSKRRTQILYDDPNSMFKSGKKIYLHELQGATLKTSKPFPTDISIGLKGADLLSSLIGKLQQIQVISKYFLDGMSDVNFYQVYNLVSIRESNKLSNQCKALIKKLSLLPTDIFNEDDIFSVISVFNDIKETAELIVSNEEFAQVAFYGTREFINYMDKIRELLSSLQVFIAKINTSIVQTPLIFPQQPQAPPQEDLVNLEPPPPLEGAGRFKVLSGRIRKQQQHNFKRFL